MVKKAYYLLIHPSYGAVSKFHGLNLTNREKAQVLDPRNGWSVTTNTWSYHTSSYPDSISISSRITTSIRSNSKTFFSNTTTASPTTSSIRSKTKPSSSDTITTGFSTTTATSSITIATFNTTSTLSNTTSTQPISASRTTNTLSNTTSIQSINTPNTIVTSANTTLTPPNSISPENRTSTALSVTIIPISEPASIETPSTESAGISAGPAVAFSSVTSPSTSEVLQAGPSPKNPVPAIQPRPSLSESSEPPGLTAETRQFSSLSSPIVSQPPTLVSGFPSSSLSTPDTLVATAIFPPAISPPTAPATSGERLTIQSSKYTSPPLSTAVITAPSLSVLSSAPGLSIADSNSLISAGPALTGLGTVLSLSPSATSLIASASAVLLSNAASIPVQSDFTVISPAVAAESREGYVSVSQSSVTPVTISASAIALGSQAFTRSAAGGYVIDSQTLTPGGPAIAVSGTVVSLAAGGSTVVIGGKTELLTSMTGQGAKKSALSEVSGIRSGSTNKSGAAPAETSLAQFTGAAIRIEGVVWIAGLITLIAIVVIV
ncbi:MAG: hypothetical protein Q9160_008008 [Pyrenula sp. 1 TL-2023]